MARARARVVGDNHFSSIAPSIDRGADFWAGGEVKAQCCLVSGCWFYVDSREVFGTLEGRAQSSSGAGLCNLEAGVGLGSGFGFVVPPLGIGDAGSPSQELQAGVDG